MQSRRRRTPVAALLPAGFLGALLVAAPYAGTTTAPLIGATPQTRAAQAELNAEAPRDAEPYAGQPAGQSQQVAEQVSVEVPSDAAVAFLVGYLAIAGVGAGTLVFLARRLRPE